MMNRGAKMIRGSIIAMLVLVGALMGCQKDDGTAVLAKVGSENITEGELMRRLDQYPAETRQVLAADENRRYIVDQLVEETLLFQLAKKEGIHKHEEFKEQMALSKRQLMISILLKEKIDESMSASDAELQAYYEENAAQFGPLERREVAHILLEDKETADKVRAELRSGKLSFSEAATQYSIDPSKGQGGSIGWVLKSQVVPAFGDVAFSLQKGKISEVVPSQFGFHIIRVLGIDSTKALSFDQAKEEIRSRLLSEKRQAAFTALVDEAKSKIKVEHFLHAAQAK